LLDNAQYNKISYYEKKGYSLEHFNAKRLASLSVGFGEKHAKIEPDDCVRYEYFDDLTILRIQSDPS
jgi:hypothetical protein